MKEWGNNMAVRKDAFETFFRKKPAMMLVALRKSSRSKYGSVLAKEIDCTYSHAVKILQGMERIGLVMFERQGRIKSIRLTKKGQDVADYIDKVKDLLV
ncbi:MAG: hypothetical protein AABX59_00280 [Nanoarchaeota archaeon]